MAMTLILISSAAVVFIATQLRIIPASTVPGGGAINPATGCINPYTAPTGYSCTKLKVAFVVSDPFASTSAAISSATVIAYDPVSLTAAESPATTDSTGTTNSASQWSSGTNWICKVSATNYVTEYTPCTVPALSNFGTQGLTSFTLPLYEVKLGTWSLTATGNNGMTAWSSSWSSYSFLNQGTTAVTVTWSLQEINNNQGYFNSFDPFKKLANLLVLELKSASTPKTTAQGCQYSVSYNQVYYCQYAMPDGITSTNGAYTVGTNPVTASFPTGVDGTYAKAQPKVQSVTASGVSATGSASQQYVGTTPLPTAAPGLVTFTTTFNAGSLSGGSEKWTATLFAYADPAFYDGTGGTSVNGQYGGDQSSQTLSPSWSTITLLN